MHRHDDDPHADGHAHHHGNGHHRHDHAGVSGYGLVPAVGHNEAVRIAQWQEPHAHDRAGGDAPEPDFDLIETAFAENFPRASDPTSFLRLARVPFVGHGSDGKMLRLLRVEFEQTTDVGALTPRVGGESFRHDPLPAALVSTRRRLRFAYFDGDGVVLLSLAETRALTDRGD